jgi:hypothetical protein
MNHTQNKLIKSIEKKCTTIMIGALARFEDNLLNYGTKKETQNQINYMILGKKLDIVF